MEDYIHTHEKLIYPSPIHLFLNFHQNYKEISILHKSYFDHNDIELIVMSNKLDVNLHYTIHIHSNGPIHRIKFLAFSIRILYPDLNCISDENHRIVWLNIHILELAWIFLLLYKRYKM